MADSKRSGARQLKVGDWHVDGNALTASNGDERRAIEPRAYKVLCYLADRPGDVVTIDELMDALWGGSVVTPNAVTRVIAHLRKVLDEDARNPKYIETVARTGYRYIAAPAQPRPSTRLRSVALAGAALAALGALLLLWLAPAPEDAAPSIAVLPFENLTGDPAQDFLGEGISEEIIAALTGLPDISVSARTESFRFRDGDADPVNVARELDVSWIVAGSVRRVNHDVRLTAQLINPVTGNHLWSLTDERDIAQLFDGQDAVSRGVLQALAKHAGLDTEIVMPAVEHAPDAKAYELYMRGRYIWHRRGTEPLQPAIDLFREAVEIDPDFSKAWNALAMAYLTYPSYSPRGYRTWYLAEDAARKALELDPALSGSYGVLATFASTRHQWTEAESLYLKGLRNDPKNPTANYWYAEFLQITGRTYDAAVGLRRTIELDPLYQAPRLTIAFLAIDARDFDEGIQRAQKHWQDGNRTQLAWLSSFIGFVGAGDIARAADWVEGSPFDETLNDLLHRFIAVEAGGEDAALADDVRDFFWRRPDYPLGFYMSARLGRHTDVFALANERLDNDLLLEMRPFWNPTLGLPEQEEFIPLMERVGLIEYWDATEWPAFCRRENETISCDMSRVTPELVAPIRDVTM